MGLFEETITKAKEIIDETGKVTGEVWETQKLKFEASSLKSDINKNYQLLGQYTYRALVNAEENAEAVENISKVITEQLEKLKKLQNSIAHHKGEIICECGAFNAEGAKYCNICGKEL